MLNNQPRFPFYLFPKTWDKEYKIPKVGKNFLEDLETFRGYSLRKAFLIDFYNLNNETLPADFSVKRGSELEEMFNNLLYSHNLKIEDIANNA